MKFDTTTIVVISIVIDTVLVLVLLHTWRTRTTYPGFTTWIVGTACWSLGSILNMLLPSMQPQFIPKIVGNALIMLHPLLLYEGIRQFHGIRSRWWGTSLNAAVVLGGICCMFYFFYLSENLVARIIAINLVASLLFARVSIEPLLYARIRKYSMQWLLSAFLLPLIALIFGRAWFYLSGSPPVTFSGALSHETLLRWIMFYGIIAEIVIAYSYLSLTSDRVEEQLKTSEQRLSTSLVTEQNARSLQERFLEMVSHEYRTPLAIIQANIDIMELKEQQADHGYSGSLNNIQHAVERLLDIFEATRRRKDFDPVTLDPIFETIEVEQLLTGVLAAARVFWGDRFICLNEQSYNHCLYADRRLLRTVFLNLLDNAVKYSATDTTITLRTAFDGEQVELAIINHPSSPLPNDTGALFQKFSRGSNSSGTSGTGQGLYLAQSIVEQHGGTLKLIRDSAGDVAAMVRLPLAAVKEGANV